MEVLGLGLRVEGVEKFGLGFRAWSLGFRLWGLGLRVWGFQASGQWVLEGIRV